MLKLLAKLFGAKDTAPAQPEAPYKVEAPVAEAAPAPVVEAAPAKKPAKKPAAPKPKKEGVKKAGGRKPKSKA